MVNSDSTIVDAFSLSPAQRTSLTGLFVGYVAVRVFVCVLPANWSRFRRHMRFFDHVDGLVLLLGLVVAVVSKVARVSFTSAFAAPGEPLEVVGASPPYGYWLAFCIAVSLASAWMVRYYNRQEGVGTQPLTSGAREYLARRRGGLSLLCGIAYVLCTVDLDLLA